MTRKKKDQKHSGKGNGSDLGPALPYRLTFKLTERERAALFKEPALVVVVRLDKTVERNGEKFGWFVHPVKITSTGDCVNLGKQILCHDEAEANAVRKSLLALFKREEEARQREEAERPIPGDTLKTLQVIGGKSLRITVIPISLLPHA